MLFVVVLITALQIVRVPAFNLSIRPDHVRTTQNPQSISFTCAADSALIGCQFKFIDDINGNTDYVVDLSKGSQSKADPAHVRYDPLSGYSYNGRGLESGDCGITLEVEGWMRWVIACRVRAESGAWKYAWADLHALTPYAALPHNLTTPKEVVVLPGGEAKFMVKTNRPRHLTSCSFHVPEIRLDLHFVSNDVDYRGCQYCPTTHRYLGAGLRSGECGLRVTDISEADNGLVTCHLQTESKSDYRFMALVVADPGTPPTLRVNTSGTNVTATCKVRACRPVANLTWLLGDDVIRQDDMDETKARRNDRWSWPWVKGSIMQTVTLALLPRDHGKVLKCVVSHVALAQPREAKTTISFPGLLPSTLPIAPMNLRLTEDLTTVNFTCNTNVPLLGCQFTWLSQREYTTDEGPVLDLSQGPQSRANESDLDWELKNYSYKGRGLETGDCGVTMQVEGYKDWVLGCRVKGYIGGWSYNWTTLFATYSAILPITTATPREKIVRVGQVETMICQSSGPISGCHFNKPGSIVRVIFNEDYRSGDSFPRHRYSGDGLATGQCGIRLADIMTYESGPIQCVLDGPYNAQGRLLSLLIVQSPPSLPTLQVTYSESHITATCTVNGSRPAANITWWLNDKVIRNDTVNDASTGLDAPWQWPWETHSISQTVTLKTSDQGAVVSCEVTHEELAQEVAAIKRIRIPG